MDPIAAELLGLVFEAWEELDAHRGRCRRADAIAARLYAALAKYAGRGSPPPPPAAA